MDTLEKDQELKEKLKLLNEIRMLEQRGHFVYFQKTYNIHDSLEEITFALETAKAKIQEKKELYYKHIAVLTCLASSDDEIKKMDVNELNHLYDKVKKRFKKEKCKTHIVFNSSSDSSKEKQSGEIN